ncbi:MAG: right-handed parallel beta-helix repeat-containing protein [Solirubrobacterales bacterium]
MWGRTARYAAAVATAFLAVPSMAMAADTYVDDDSGNDANPCTSPGAPCLTILGGIGKAGASDTVRVDGGNYGEFVSLSGGKSLVEQDFNTTDGDSQATIDSGALGPAIAVPAGGSAGEIRGFTVRSDALPVSLEGPATLTGNNFDDPDANTHVNLLQGSGAASVTTNTFTDTPADTDGQFGLSTITSGSPTIAGNTFENLQTAIHIANGNATVSGNTITGARAGGSNVGVAIQVVSGSPTIVANDINTPAQPLNAFGILISEFAGPTATGATLRRNEVYDHRGGVRTNDTEGTVTLNGDVIAGNTESGILAVDNAAGGDEGDVTATNVTAFDNNNDVVLLETHIELDSSIVGDPVGDFNNGTCAIAFSRGPTTTPGGTGCAGFQTTAAPQFVNPGADNYHLQAGSPMIDAGDPANPGFVVDLDGQSRAVAGTCGGTARRDIGADEFAPNCPPPPPPPPGADTNPPDTEITKAPKRKTPKRKARIEFSSDETGSSFACKLDKREFAACTSPFRKKVKRGRHSFQVRAIDDSGNADPTPAVHEWKVKRKRR